MEIMQYFFVANCAITKDYYEKIMQIMLFFLALFYACFTRFQKKTTMFILFK